MESDRAYMSGAMPSVATRISSQTRGVNGAVMMSETHCDIGNNKCTLINSYPHYLLCVTERPRSVGHQCPTYKIYQWPTGIKGGKLAPL